MNWAQFKVSVSHICVLMALWQHHGLLHRRWVAGSSPFNDKYLGKTPLCTGDKAHKTREAYQLQLNSL